MLVATIEENGKKRKEEIFVIDSHSHLGKDEDGATMMNPLAPGSGSFDFWSKIQGRIIEDWEESDEQSFHTRMDGNNVKISLSFEPYPFADKLFTHLQKLGKKYSDIKEKLKFNTFIDMAVVFPFQDVFRDKQPEALYRASNLNISRFTNQLPFSLKIMGYCRVDPQEGQKAINEVRYARETLGLRGLKLHPRSEGWVDAVRTGEPIPIMLEAIKHSMPIIFDTRGKKTIMDLGELIRNTRNMLKNKYPDLLPHFKAIVAHFAQGNVGDYEVYNTVVQPNTYGDLSMLHGEGAKNFFKDFRQWFESNHKENINNRSWSEYLLFATDYPYFGEIHAEKLLINLFNKDFFENGGTLRDTKNILGLNQIRILPEYSMKQDLTYKNSYATTIISNPHYSTDQQSSYEMAISALAKLIADNKIDIKRFLFEFENDWDTLSDNVLISAIKKSTKEEVPLYLVEMIENHVSLLSPLASYSNWKKFGYKFFNPDDRTFFSSLMKNYYLANNVEDAEKGLLEIFP
ncbi:MAG: Amidohydrolase [Promethearchaeota archaeon]|nr:MAG: Amidohydrolase [Candidatus Lokiarchaeota archaeon]